MTSIHIFLHEVGNDKHQHHQFPLRGRPRPYPEGIHSVAGNSRQNQCKINPEQQSAVGMKATGSSEKREATQNYTILKSSWERQASTEPQRTNQMQLNQRRGTIGKGENEKTLSTPLTLTPGKRQQEAHSLSRSYQGPALGQREVQARQQSVRVPCVIWALTCVPTSEQEGPTDGCPGMLGFHSSPLFFSRDLNLGLSGEYLLKSKCFSRSPGQPLPCPSWPSSGAPGQGGLPGGAAGAFDAHTPLQTSMSLCAPPL